MQIFQILYVTVFSLSWSLSFLKFALNCLIDVYREWGILAFLRAKAAVLSARLSYRNSVRPSVCHKGGSGKNGPS